MARAAGATRSSYVAAGKLGPVTASGRVTGTRTCSRAFREFGHSAAGASVPGVARVVLVEEEAPGPSHHMAPDAPRELHGNGQGSFHFTAEAHGTTRRVQLQREVL